MHPVLGDRKRLALYLLAWVLLAILLAVLAVEPGSASVRRSIELMVPPTLVFAFICLAARYPVRAMPLRATFAARAITTHVLAAIVISAAWLLLLQAWSSLLGLSDAIDDRVAVLLMTGALLYLLSVAGQYLFIAVEDRHELEKRAMEVEVLAREAELKALRAQLDPHFLFNSLNSVSALCGSNPASARTLTTLLAEYLRKSLRFGAAQSITLSEELELASSYLAIERIRFGPRLEFEQVVDESVRAYRVPPLLLQPVVENAITHGVGHLLEGGVIHIAAAKDGERVRITVENRCDPDRPSSRGEGIGLANTRRRVATYYGPAARVEVVEEAERFRVALSLPA